MPHARHIARLAIVLAIAAACVGCARDDDSAGEVVAAAPDPAAAPELEAGGGVGRAGGAGVVVDVAGSVRRPGVYRLPPGSRVHEAIDAAGGARSGAQLGSLNRAAILQDGQQVLVPSTRDEADSPRSGGAGGGSTVNLNVADAAALDALPGIGMVTAERIVADREASGPFASVDDLDRVPGIGPATVDALREVAVT